MKALNEIKVLVVEDDANWKEALCQMYKQIIPQCHVNSASSGIDALRMIENGEKFDLLSLDINLGITHPKTEVGHPDLNVYGADGRSVLRRAHELNACKGLIVITGLAYDTTLALVIPDLEESKRVRMTLHAYLQDLFPGKNLYLKKYPESKIPESIRVFMKALSCKRLLSLCEDEDANRFCQVGEYWHITFAGETVLVKNRVGLRYIAYLLQNPDNPLHSCELERIIGTGNIEPSSKVYVNMPPEQLSEYGLDVRKNLGDVDEPSDHKALESYKSEFKEIEKQLQEAKEFNDPALIQRLEREEEWLSKEILSRWGRKSASVEKSRKNVQKAIQRSLEKIKKDHRKLWLHLTKSLSTGNFCIYSPSNPTDWIF
ncbi:MAG: response regulator [Candidatus Aminicenantes bacterium]|nr:response regulator [Candidatus Aminicenantes bacterium]